jgi:hypothetical protein
LRLPRYLFAPMTLQFIERGIADRYYPATSFPPFVTRLSPLVRQELLRAEKDGQLAALSKLYQRSQVSRIDKFRCGALYS